MHVLTVPNWSFGRNRALLQEFTNFLEHAPVAVHYLASDVDHNRTVSAFSGTWESVTRALMVLSEFAFDSIDLNHHVGVHPRIGALDVCPFLNLGPERQDLVSRVDAFGQKLALRFELPVYLYEKSERGRHESDLPALRKGGFGGLLGRELAPDYGPRQAHPRLGVTVLGVRDFLIAFNVDLDQPDPKLAKELAKRIRSMRSEGDPRFLGVRALGFPLASRDQSQVSLNVTLPDLTSIDPIVEWVSQEAAKKAGRVAGTELIGVIRPKDLAGATRLKIKDEQIVD